MPLIHVSWSFMSLRPSLCRLFLLLYFCALKALSSGESCCSMFADEHDFHRRLAQAQRLVSDPQSSRYQNNVILLLLYDSEENTIREALIHTPLGCEVGNGLMHTIASSKGDPRLPVISLFLPVPYSESGAPGCFDHCSLPDAARHSAPNGEVTTTKGVMARSFSLSLSL